MVSSPFVSARPPRRTSRRFWIVAGLIGGFLVLDLAFFSWLIFQSLRQRELDRVLFEARQEAQQLAARLQSTADGTGGDLFTAVSLAQGTQGYIDEILRQRPIVQTVEITDRQGVLVMRQRRDPAAAAEPPAPATPRAPEPTLPEALESLEVTVPIGEYGSLRIGLSPTEMTRRLTELRRDLQQKTLTLGGLTFVLVAVAVAMIWVLIRRGERLEAQAAEAERLAYVGTLAAGLAHEIRNPLNSLNLNMQMLEEDLPPGGGGEAGRRLLGVTRAEIARLERLVSEFLLYARPRPLQLAEVAAVDLLITARDVLAAEIARRGIALRLVDESEEALVRVDEEQIRQLMLNLLQNAIHATEGTGRRADILLLARRDGDRVELEVHDNGRGIPPAERSRIFDAFFSTRKGGTGLGLAIAERIARAHGGTLTCDSDFGFGSRFVLALPAAAAEPSTPAG
jgi:signal transduction histidine kinase